MQGVVTPALHRDQKAKIDIELCDVNLEHIHAMCVIRRNAGDTVRGSGAIPQIITKLEKNDHISRKILFNEDRLAEYA